ncbi:aspartic peptidase domain-containing protein, partial [Cladorrhinum samala]
HSNVILDTGSPIPLLLPLSTCPTCNRGQLEQRPHNLFDPSLSSTFTSTNPAIPVQLSFGSAGGGTVPYSTPQGANCTVVRDTLTVGAHKIKNQQFLLCDEYSEGLRDQFADGILGLSSVASGAWPDGNQTEYGAVLAGLAGVKEFSVDFEEGRIVFGGGSNRGDREGVKNVKLEEELSKSRGGWVVETRWEGGDNDHDHDGGGEEAQEAAVALLDTGSAVMVTPDFDTARRLYGSMSRDIRPIDSLGSWGVECEVWEKMGRDVKFVVGGSRGEKVEVVVKKEFLNVGEYPGQPGICQGLFLHPLTQAREPLRGRPAWIFGNALLRGYVTVWNWEEMSVGFGKVRGDPER